MTTNTQSHTATTQTDKNQKRRKGVRGPSPSQPADHIKIGLDVGLRRHGTCRQVDNSLQEPPSMKSMVQLKLWILEQRELAKKVTVCYEACLFGFGLARWLMDHNIDCVVMAPVKLDEGNRRVETDKINARDIVSRLDRYLAGNTRALTACRIPTEQEELARHQTRQRQQLLDHRKSLDAQGKSLLWQFGQNDMAARKWWEDPRWSFIEKTSPEIVVASLKRTRAVIQEINKQLEELEAELTKQARSCLPARLKELPAGIGLLSILILTREVMAWPRFNNRRQMSCFTGLVPSESSSGESFRQGSVTKVGNPVVRACLVEMAWRLVRYQPNYHAFKKWGPILRNKKAGARARKKAVVAVARILGVDLWRLATEQTTCEQLGLTGLKKV